MVVQLPLDPPKKQSRENMAGFVDIKALKSAEGINLVWPMHYCDKFTKIYNGQPVMMPAHDTQLKKGEVYDMFQKSPKVTVHK